MQRSALSPELRGYVDRYGQSHRHPVNKALHFLGIPVLAVSSLGLLAQLAVPLSDVPRALQPNAAWLVLLGASAWYLLLDRRVGLCAAAGLVACYAVSSALPLMVLLGLFAAGVVAHVIGHYGFEGKPPALFKSPVAVLEAPAWLLSTWAGIYP
jgi:uncharacterized membrane protein YGL010W